MVINVEIENEIDEIISILPAYNKITLNNFNNAKCLMAYYNINRILMAGYKLNLISANNETNLDNFFNSIAIVNIPIPFSKDL
jgi:hypothetical protein